ncbi:MAG TPA: adenylate/guanylate cyclase domain-containing protein, partial [Pseudomonadales bacterium]|nr:adenylate/guanylate cyclase domain-containing protein [Pseudomonadales bacterium]
MLTFVYFRYLDPAPGGIGEPPGGFEIGFSVAAFALLAVAGYLFGRRWTSRIRLREGTVDDEVRRSAVLVPFLVGGITFLQWTLAGVIWGVLLPWYLGVLSWPLALRTIFGTTIVAGTVASLYAFLSVERRWRSVLPAFFPEGGITRVPGTPRLRVRLRLLVVFLLISILPVSVLGVVSYNRARALAGAPPGAAASLATDLLVLIAFVMTVGIAAALVLAVSVSRSVAEPLSALADAMAEVEEGRLDTRCPVVSKDEIGDVAEGFNRMVKGLQERERVTEIFGKYVSREVRDEILAGRVALEGQQLEVTILFCDLRDFTPWVEAADPREVVRDLNGYFGEMEAAIRGQHGLVLQYIGDEIEAVFGAPVAHADHAEQAVRSAMDMRARLAAWNRDRERAGKTPLRHGIGVHTGTVLAGSIGSRERLSYALVGDAVNLASRIQGLTKELGGDILVSGTTHARLGGRIPL